MPLRRIFYTLAGLHANPGLSRVLRCNSFTATYGGSLSNIGVGVQHFGSCRLTNTTCAARRAPSRSGQKLPIVCRCCECQERTLAAAELRSKLLNCHHRLREQLVQPLLLFWTQIVRFENHDKSP